MSQVRRIPFRGSETLGRGYNVLVGEAVGKALEIVTTEKAVSGQEAFYDVQIVETHESLMESFGLSIEASGRYGMFSAEGKFALSEKSSFNSQSTFVVASCRIKNAFEIADQIHILPEAQQLREKPDLFKTAFGTSFVRGLQTGGEFYAVLQVTSTDSATQKSLGASFQADCQGLVASLSFSAKYDQAKASTQSETHISVTVYQRAGQDEQLSYTSDAAAVIQRLKDFPRIAHENPCGYEAEIADYNTLALPMINEEEVADREMALADCARLRLKYMTYRNDIEFARQNRQFFDELPADTDLETSWNAYSRAVGLVQRHAQVIASRSEPPTVFDLSEANPPLSLPVVLLKRKNVPSTVSVPVVVGLPLEAAQSNLTQVGLASTSNSVAVTAESGQTVNVVTAQEPVAGSLVQPASPIQLTYNYVPSQRFPWARRLDRAQFFTNPQR